MTVSRTPTTPCCTARPCAPGGQAEYEVHLGLLRVPSSLVTQLGILKLFGADSLRSRRQLCAVAACAP